MKRLLVLFVLLFTVLFSYTVVAQELGSLKKGVEHSFPEKIQKLVLDPLPAGTYSIGTGGYFETIQSAFDKLSTDGVAGEVILELIDNLYIAPTGLYGFFLNGPIPGAGPTSRVTLKPAANKNVTVEGDGEAVLNFLNTSYVTVDGVSITGATTLTIHALYNGAYIYNDCLDFLNNSDHNVIQNIIIMSEDITRLTGAGFFTSVITALAPDSNLIQNNFVKKAGCGLYVGGSPSYKATGNIIKENIVGSETDSLIAWGIEVELSQNVIVENNVIQNLKVTGSAYYHITPGINSYCGYGGIIRNNIVHNIKSNAGYSSVGILLSGSAGEAGSNNQIYNNMVYDIQSTSTYFDNRVTGIQMWHQNNPKIYYNSVYLSGTGANVRGSAALFIDINCTNIDAKNNILVNTRDESPYCASAIFDFSASNLTSNYNDLYYEPNQYNCMVSAGGTNYLTLADWQVTGQDLNSITEMPNFVDPYLHINENILTILDSSAIPISGIDIDFDGDTRNASTPDIGADEFDIIIIGVEDETNLPTEFTLEQNYPNPFNPSTSIQYEISNRQFVSLKVYDVLGIEIETLVNEEKPVGSYEITWYPEQLPSGVYFYQLKAGDYINTKKMLLLK